MFFNLDLNSDILSDAIFVVNFRIATSPPPLKQPCRLQIVSMIIEMFELINFLPELNL